MGERERETERGREGKIEIEKGRDSGRERDRETEGDIETERNLVLFELVC